MDQEQDPKPQAGLNRRKFIGVLGAAAIAAGGIPRKAAAQAPPPPQTVFLNSFGQIQACAADTLAAGIVPPPLLQPPQTNSGTQQTHQPSRRFGRFSRKRRFRPAETIGCQYSSCTTTQTTLSPGYPKYNILMIIVDQMRNPRWLPQGVTDLNSILTHIAQIYNNANVFSNCYAAATNCSPSRAALMSGLYSQ